MEVRLLFLILGIMFCSCTGGKEATTYPGGSFVVQGTIRFVNIETGCWLLVLEDGTQYEPAGEDLSVLWRDGLTVSLLVRPMKGVAGICQAGEIVEVIQILKTGDE
ncbi:MAG: hypothetical protein OEV30_03160 [Ignavibacteria bacterium]|nr:hypothetical protein [Ignavibacteria bacterium]